MSYCVTRIAIARKLEEIGVPEIEIGYVGAIQEHAELSRKLKIEGIKPKLVSHTRIYTRKDEWKDEINKAVDAGSDILCLLASMSETLCATTPWLPKESVTERIAESVEYTNKLGIFPALTLVDGIRTPLEDILNAYQVAYESGVKRIYVMDGQGVALPETVSFIVKLLVERFGNEIEIACHFHNDYGLATANTLCALKSGASVADVVVNGLGDKAGIGALEEVVTALEILYGVNTGIDMRKLVELSEFVQERFNIPVSANKPIVGPNIVRHQIDSHMATILRGYWWAWEEIKPEYFGRERSLEWAYGKLRTGRSGSLQAKLEAMGVNATDEQYDELESELRELVEKNQVVNERELEKLIQDKF